ncbi:hypothetical protein EBR96_04200 [bacterium]|nr:hypothetical protein [bacterium]
MKKLFVLLIISMLGIWAVKISGADRPKVAILEFSTINIPQQFGVLTPDWLSVGLVKSNRFVVLERTNIEKILQEKKIERTALFDPSQIQKFASLIGATHVIYGSISDRTGQAFSAMDWFMSNAQQRIEINVKLADIKTGEIVYSDSVYADSRELIERAIARLTTKLLAQVPMNGVILEVSGKDVFIDLGASDGVAEGDMFEVVSQGRTVTHPVTGEVVTLPERRSAEVVVNEVYPRTLKGRLIVAKGAQELEIARGMAVRSNNVKQNSLSQNLRRVNDIYSSSVGMGYVGLASAQGSIFNINPAGLPQVQNSEISLSWKYVGSTFGITQQGVYKEHLNGYSPFKDNALFPNGLNFVAAFGDGLGLGVNLHTDGVATNPKSDLNFENGQFEYSISLGKAFNPHFMAGLAIGGVNQWHAYEPQGVASTNYSFRGNHWMTKFGVLFRPDKDLSLGGIVAVPLSKSSGPGKVGEASNDYQVVVRKYNPGIGHDCQNSAFRGNVL